MGRVIAKTEVEGLVVRHSVFAAEERVAPHVHELPQISLQLSGLMWDTVGNAVCTLTTDAVYVASTQRLHQHRAGPQGSEWLCIDFKPSRLAELREVTSALDEPGMVGLETGVKIGRRINRELHLGDRASRLAIVGLTYELITTLDRNRRDKTGLPRRPRWLACAEALLQECVTKQISLAEIAGQVGVHPVHLARAFRRHVGVTIGSYVRSLQVDRASALLSDSDATLAQIALASGFYDQAHFCHIFKRMTGFTPGRYRACVRGR